MLSAAEARQKSEKAADRYLFNCIKRCIDAGEFQLITYETITPYQLSILNKKGYTVSHDVSHVKICTKISW